MSFESIRDAVDSLRAGNPVDFSQTIKNILMDKLVNRMDVEKVSVASQMFGDVAPDAQSSEATNGEDS